MTLITIKGRNYKIEIVTDEAGNPKTAERRPVYRLVGTRGAAYLTVRNRPNPDLMFLIAEGGALKLLNGVWLTDKDGTLRVR